MKKSLALIGVLLLCCLFVGGVSASAEGGLHDGTYLIYDSADLVAFASYINGDVTHVSTNAKLMADIDLSSVSSWTPIGTNSNQYAGTFDGNGYVISSLSITTLTNTYTCGLIGIGSGLTVQNLGIVDSNINIENSYPVIYTAFICGYIPTGNTVSTFNNCYVDNVSIYLDSNAISGNNIFAGGIVGCSDNSGYLYVSNCYTNIVSYYVSAYRWAYFGGILGSKQTQNCEISNCYCVGNMYQGASVDRFPRAAGIVGLLVGNDISISNSVSLVNSYTAGITSNIKRVIGYVEGEVTLYNNYGLEGATINGVAVTGGATNNPNGADVSNSIAHTRIFYEDNMRWNFNTIWYWDSTANLPKLRAFLHTPTVSEITINADKGAINTQYSPQITPTISNLGGASTVYYKVQVSTDGTTYSDASSVSSTTTTGQKSAITATSFTDTTARTHYYRVIATPRQNIWAGDSVFTSTTVTFTTYAPPSTPTARNPDPNQIGTGVAISVGLSATSVPTAPEDLTYTYQWYYASSTTPSAGDTAIGTAQTTYQDSTWSISSSTFTSPTTKYLYLKITDSLSQTTYSNRVELQVMDLSATANFNPPTYQGLEDTIRLAVIGNQPLMTYQWYYKTTGEYQLIDQATTQYYQTTANALGISSGTAIKFKCVVSYMGSTYNLETGTLTPYASPVVNAPTASSIKFAVPGTTTLTAHVVDSSLVSSYQWQIYQSSAWTNIASATASTYTASISTAGVYQYRVSVLGINGHSVESTAISITTGAAPTVTITAPTQGQTLEQKGQVNLTATATGVGNTYVWNIGDSSLQHGDLTSLNSWVKYKLNGAKTVSITATNEYGSATSTVSFTYRDPSKRDMASATLSPVPTSAVSNLTSVVDVTPGTYPSIKATVQAVMAPIEEVMPTGFVFVIVFGVIFLMLWLITKNTAVPAIIGVIFGGFLLALFPASYYGPALIILAISIAGGMYRVFRPPQ